MQKGKRASRSHSLASPSWRAGSGTLIRHHSHLWENSLSPQLSGKGTADCQEMVYDCGDCMSVVLWVESFHRGELASDIWLLSPPPTPSSRKSKSREPHGAFRLIFSSGIPLYLEQRLHRQRKQVPICYNLEISKFPQFMLCLFWKIPEMSTDKWRSPEECFEKIAKLNHSESQSASKLLFLGSMPDLNKQNKQKINRNSKLKGPVSNLIQTLTEIGVTSSNQSSKFIFKLLTDLK